MSKANTEVKWFHSGMLDGPVMRGQAGAMIEVLDACLINGFSTRTPDSFTVADGVATVTFGAGNPYERHSVIKITGASDAALIDEWRIATSAATTLTFACPGVADGTITGASVIRAPAGWAKPFSDVNIGVYQSADPESTQLYLRVDDSNAVNATVRGYENMTAANSGTGPFPTVAQAASGVFWLKSGAAGSTPRTWAIYADGSVVYLYLATATAEATNPAVVAFGDLVSNLNADSYHCMIAGAVGASASPGVNAAFITNDSIVGCYLARLANQTTQSAVFRRDSIRYRSGFVALGSVIGRSDSTFDVTILRYPVLANDGDAIANTIRGILPGMFEPMSRYYTTTAPAVFDGAGAYAGKAFAGMSVGQNNVYGSIVFDITGPWR